MAHNFPSDFLHILEITYNGYKCLMPDVNGELFAHVERHYSQFFEPANPVRDGLSLAHTHCGARAPVILPSWNLEPRLGLYQLYKPRGFSRSAKIYILIHKDAVSACNRSPSDEYNALFVKWKTISPNGTVLERSISPQMTVTQRAYVTEDVVLCELRDQRFAWASQILDDTLKRPQSMTLRDFVVALSGEFRPARKSLAGSNALNYLPDVNVDLDSLWRYDTPICNLLDASLGGYCDLAEWIFFDEHSGYFGYQANINFPSPTCPEPEVSQRFLFVKFPQLINGRVRNDLPYVFYKFGNGELFSYVTCSAPSTIPTNNSEIYKLAFQINYAESLSETLFGKKFQRLARYDHADREYGDAVIFDFNASGAGVGLSSIPEKSFPYQRHYYWIKDTKPTCEPMDVIRVQLLENLPVCSDAAAVHLSNLENTENCPCGFVRQVLVRDTAGIARTRIQNNQRFAPVQSMGFARHLACADTGEMDVYELISIGQGCCPPPDSSDVPNCCQQWFTRYENLGTVTDKSVGAVIATGEMIGSLKVTGGDYWLDYKAYLSNSDSSDGCGIDLSGIHEFSQEKTSRTSGTSPCSPSATQCAIDFALLQMSGRLPVEKAACNIWYEDLGGAGNGNDYHRRRLKSTLPGCAAGKKVYNVSSVFTTVLTKGADYVVLKHWCADASSSSSSGADECCAQFTDYDMRCVGGVLQRWKKETEVCWNGDCLDTRIISDWAPTGQTAGCCSCTGSESGSSGGGGGGGSSGGGGGGGGGGGCPVCCETSATLNFRLVFGNKTYTKTLLRRTDVTGWAFEWEVSDAPSCLLDDVLQCGGAERNLWLNATVYCQLGQWYVAVSYELLDGPRGTGPSRCSMGNFVATNVGGCPLPYSATGTGTYSTPFTTWNTDCPWSISITCGGGGVGGLSIVSTGSASNIQGSSAVTLGTLTASGSAMAADVMASSEILLNLLNVTSGSLTASGFVYLTGVTVNSSASGII